MSDNIKPDNEDARLTPSQMLDRIIQRDDNFDAIDAQKALCLLTEEVMDKAIGFAHPSDCFCGFGGFNDNDGNVKHKTYDEGYRNDGAAIRYIVAATRAAYPKQRPRSDDEALASAE